MKDWLAGYKQGWEKAWHMSRFSERLRIVMLLKQYARQNELDFEEVIELVKGA